METVNREPRDYLSIRPTRLFPGRIDHRRGFEEFRVNLGTLLRPVFQ